MITEKKQNAYLEYLNAFKDFFRQEQMHKVFEMFILNFYALHLDRRTYRVHAPKINWHIAENATDIWGRAFDVDDDPGDRRTDIVVENKALNLQMIFDAKYYKKTFVEAYMNSDEQRTRTGHLNQVRGYLIDSEFPGSKVGALLYPMVNDDLKRGRIHPIEGTPIIIKSINLNAEWRDIEADMLDFVHRVETPYRHQRLPNFHTITHLSHDYPSFTRLLVRELTEIRPNTQKCPGGSCSAGALRILYSCECSQKSRLNKGFFLQRG